ncbi:MAG: hypothetical protein JWQ09_5700 [Segetibacter sp.]|nr:hypothetical protein [Segetibacter sp.]
MEEKRIIELLTRKLAGEASDEELIELKELIEKNPDSFYTEEVFGEIWNSKVQVEDENFFYKRHKRKYREEFDFADGKEYIEDVRDLKHKRNKYLAGSLCIVLLLAVTGYLFFSSPGKTTRIPAYTEIISGKGVRKSVTLPDGTNVWLNADSRLSFDANIHENNIRVVELAGEAFFDVVHIKDRPFIIHTKKVSITVLGTAFNVKAYPGEKNCETTLIRGSIELVTNDKAKQKFILKPSEKFSVIERKTKGTAGIRNSDKGNDSSFLLIEYITPVKLANKEYVPETSWTENKLIFENETLDELVPKLERWYNVKIDITAKSRAGYKFTGSFANETIEQALTAMKLIKPFNFKINDKNIAIY